jgi:hypothetical protein
VSLIYWTSTLLRSSAFATGAFAEGQGTGSLALLLAGAKAAGPVFHRGSPDSGHTSLYSLPVAAASKGWWSRGPGGQEPPAPPPTPADVEPGVSRGGAEASGAVPTLG